MQEPPDSPRRWCFGCGDRNPEGLHIDFEIEGKRVCGRFRPRETHQGWPGLAHGGVAAAAVFGLSVPTEIKNVPNNILTPRSTWADKAAYDTQAQKLAGMFRENFAKFEKYVPGGHRSPFGTLLDNAYNEEYGAETTDQAALNLMYLLGYNAKPGNFSVYGKSDERYHIVGGNSLLPQEIAGTLANPYTGTA